MATGRRGMGMGLGLAILAGLGGPAEAIPLESWDLRIETASRFELVLGGAAVLDHETGLVWEQDPGGIGDWPFAVDHCYRRALGLSKSKSPKTGRASGLRMGWRLPTVEELTSLVDRAQDAPALPPDHPFDVGTGFSVLGHWTMTTDPADPQQAWVVSFFTGDVFTATKVGSLTSPVSSQGLVWCVRGGHGHDGGH